MLHESAGPSNGAFVSFDFKAYFISEKQLWATDGTSEGTKLVRDFEGQPQGLTNAGTCLFLAVGNTLWRSDGTTEGSRRIAEVQLANPRFFPSKSVGEVPDQIDEPLLTSEKEEKLPEKKFKPTPLGLK